MALGDALAYNYDIPRMERVAPAPQSMGGRSGRGAGQAPELDFGQLDALKNVEGATHQLYQKVAALKGFAHKMYNDYGVDITQPDVGNPQAIQAHNLFLKAQADIFNTANNLKNQQRDYAAFQQASLKDPNLQLTGNVDRSASQFDSTLHASNLGMTDRVAEWNKEADVYYNKGNAKQANDYLRNRANFLRQEREDLLDQGAPLSRIEEITNEIKMIREGMAKYDPSKDLDRWQRGQKEQKPPRLIPFMNRILSGETSLLENHDDYDFTPAADGSGLIVTKKGTQQVVDRINLGSSDAHEKLGGYINTHPAYGDFYSKDRYEDEIAVGQVPYNPEGNPEYDNALVAFGDDIMAGNKQAVDALKSQILNRDVNIDLPEEVRVEKEAEGNFIDGIVIDDDEVVLTVYDTVDDSGKKVGVSEIVLNTKNQRDRDLFRKILNANRAVMDIPNVDKYAKQGKRKRQLQQMSLDDPEGFTEMMYPAGESWTSDDPL